MAEQSTTYNEAEAVKLLVEGRPEGYEQIYARYAYSVARIGFRFLRSKELTEDLVQEVFSSVWINRERFANVEFLERYLHSMCTNKAITYLKTVKVRQVGEREYARIKLTSENNTEGALLEKECHAQMQSAIDKLPITPKRVYELVTNKGLTHKEVADQLNISEQTVSNSMAIVIKTVKQHLGHLVTILVVSSSFVLRHFF